jgi:Anti-sigma factor NepR
MADDNVHWLRDTYGPALRAFYAELLREPVPQKFKDLLTRFEAEAALGDGKAPPEAAAGQAAMAQPAAEQPADASE